MRNTNRASIEMSLFWESKYASHEEKIFLEKVDFWRDIFPREMGIKAAILEEGDTFEESFYSGEIVSHFDEKKIITFNEKSLKKLYLEGNLLQGRFYQKGIAWTIFNCFKGNREPFRVIEVKDGFVIADSNHPLAKFGLSIELKFVEKLFDKEERGGECNHIPEIITKDGPGFQIPYPGKKTDFYTHYPFTRINEENDSIFYKKPRFVNHIDDTAIKNVKSLYSKYLEQNLKILDLMSSFNSHLPDFYGKDHVIGLGMNEEEMRANKNLSDFVFHDLNLDQHLPFTQNEFDAVICNFSIEYLVKPLEVTREVARVIKPGGIFITIISDRWFPGKEISIWSEMHPFERLGFVLDLYLKCGMFENLKTQSIRGFPRPYEDKYFNSKKVSDPIFLAYGKVKG